MRIIKGHYRNDSGTLSIGTLMVDSVDGRFFEAESGATLEARRYSVSNEIEGIEIISPDSCIEFLPNEGEAERIGMPVA